MDVENSRRKRVDDKVSTAVGNNEAVEPHHANHRSFRAKENEAFDTRKFSEPDRIDSGIVRIERKFEHSARSPGIAHVPDFNRIGPRFRSHFHEAVPIRNGPLRSIGAIAQVVDGQHTHAGMSRRRAVRKLHLQGECRFRLGSARNLPVVATGRNQTRAQQGRESGRERFANFR